MLCSMWSLILGTVSPLLVNQEPPADHDPNDVVRSPLNAFDAEAPELCDTAYFSGLPA